MTVSIFGCGWFGLHFAKTLISEGHEVKGSTTTPEKIEDLRSNGIQPYLINFLSASHSPFDTSFFRCDLLVIAIPPKVRYSTGDDYMFAIKELVRQVKSNQIPKVLLISSTSVLGDLNSEVDELTVPTPTSRSGEVMLESELHFRSEKAFSTTIVRFGGLVGPDRDPGRFFAGKKKIPNGRAPVNLIHLQDCSSICNAIIAKNAFGYTIHACSSDHPRKMDFYRLCTRKSRLPEPEFIDELKEWKIVNSVHIQTLLDYDFKVKNWSEWINAD
ncbi:MAG: NAD(P)H-binding protein [Chryseolinea sp.]